MYPSIIASAGISPESIDMERSMFKEGCRFTRIVVHVCTLTVHEGTIVGACVIGEDDTNDSHDDPCMQCILVNGMTRSPRK